MRAANFKKNTVFFCIFKLVAAVAELSLCAIIKGQKSDISLKMKHLYLTSVNNRQATSSRAAVWNEMSDYGILHACEQEEPSLGLSLADVEETRNDVKSASSVRPWQWIRNSS